MHRLRQQLVQSPSGPIKAPTTPILCQLTDPSEVSRRTATATPLILEPVHLAAAGFTTAQLQTLIRAACLDEGCIQRDTPGQSAKRKLSVPPPKCRRCLILTKCGRALLACYLKRCQGNLGKEKWIALVVLALRQLAERPIWKSQEAELWCSGILAKRYRSNAADQRCLLNAFQASGWAPCIDNPLPVRMARCRKLRLRYTIKAINRGQCPQLIRFHGDGHGGIRWEAVMC